MSRFLKPYLAAGPLSHLSVGKAETTTLTNAQRREAFYERIPHTLHNAYPWKHVQRKVASLPEGVTMLPVGQNVAGGGRR